LKFSLAPSVVCDPCHDFHERKFIQAQNRTAGDIFILECERKNKDGLFLFQAQAVKFNKL
jgi:hypothetical protein